MYTVATGKQFLATLEWMCLKFGHNAMILAYLALIPQIIYIKTKNYGML